MSTYLFDRRGAGAAAWMLAGLLAAWPAAAQPSAPAQTGAIQGSVRVLDDQDHANVHNGPTSTQPVLVLVPAGTVLPVIGKRGEWYEVRLAPALRRTGSPMRWYRDEDRGFVHQSAVQEVPAHTRFEPEMQRFDEADRINPPPSGPVVFTGSSTIRRWDTLAADFPHVRVLNRGFGGSEASDVVHYADRVVLRYRPSRVVFYAGDNDTARGKTAAQIAADVRRFTEIVHAALPDTEIAIVSIKPSLARWHLVDVMKEANALLQQMAARDPRVSYVDVFTPMVGPDGKPIPEHFVEDGLHLSPAGYRVWTAALTSFLRPSASTQRHVQ